jgi:hypothetical protein
MQHFINTSIASTVTSINKVSLVYIVTYSNTGSIRDDFKLLYKSFSHTRPRMRTYSAT